MRKIGLLFAFVAMLSGLYGCGGAPEVKPAAVAAPEWVAKGTGAYGGERGRVFYGVGSASGIGNASLLRSTADNRARNEVAKIFEVYSLSLMKDYMASTTAG